MVINQKDVHHVHKVTRRHAGNALLVDAFFYPSIVTLTSVPSPGAHLILALPPMRLMRSTMESLIPWRSSGMASESKPSPRSRTKMDSSPARCSAYTSTESTPACLPALTIASRSEERRVGKG